MTERHTPILSATLGFCRRLVPTREALEASPWLRPFAHGVLRSDLWRLNRRSVPRAIALGFFLGVLIPFAHSVLAALLAVVVRANVPVAVAATWISNPLTWLVMWPLAYRLGHFLMHLDWVLGLQPMAGAVSDRFAPEMLDPNSLGKAGMGGHEGHRAMVARLSEIGITAACGLLAEAVVLASVGYVVAALVWRLGVFRRRRGRLARALLARTKLQIGA